MKSSSRSRMREPEADVFLAAVANDLAKRLNTDRDGHRTRKGDI